MEMVEVRLMEKRVTPAGKELDEIVPEKSKFAHTR